MAGHGQLPTGVAAMRRGLEDYRRIGLQAHLGMITAWLAATMGKAGQAEEALALLPAEFDRTDTTGERPFEAELHRVPGELLLSLTGRQAEGETHLLQALAVARRQRANLFELRPATTLAGWWRDQDQRRDARELLAPVHGWFTESLDSADLKDARHLLDELAAEC